MGNSEHIAPWELGEIRPGRRCRAAPDGHGAPPRQTGPKAPLN
ncbi:hypothetical protein BN2364_3029 [Alloalcanivorax xenomutans]|nr:hypothetical protein BN2364_3029 [Alloalcanivorax xenomutans]